MGRERGRALARGLTCCLAPGHTDVSSSSDTGVHFTANVNLNIYVSVASAMFVPVINLKTTLFAIK